MFFKASFRPKIRQKAFDLQRDAIVLHTKMYWQNLHDKTVPRKLVFLADKSQWSSVRSKCNWKLLSFKILILFLRKSSYWVRPFRLLLAECKVWISRSMRKHLFGVLIILNSKKSKDRQVTRWQNQIFRIWTSDKPFFATMSISNCNFVSFTVV